jgi:hypothetical protein
MFSIFLYNQIYYIIRINSYMICGSSYFCPFFVLLSYDRLSKKPLLFKSFTAGLSVQEFDDIHNKKIAKKYDKHKIQRLSSTKRKNRKPSTGAGSPFKLDTRDRFLMLLVYYTRLYITYTLVGFLLDLDQSNICRYPKD